MSIPEPRQPLRRIPLGALLTPELSRCLGSRGAPAALRRLQPRDDGTCGGKAALACCFSCECTNETEVSEFHLVNSAEHDTSWCFGCLL